MTTPIKSRVEIIAQIEDIFNTADHWNRSVRKHDEEPIDPDPDGVLKRQLGMINRMLAREDGS